MSLSGPLTEQEIENGKAIFEALDQDNDGKISTGDLKQGLSNVGLELTDDEAETVIGMADADGSGSVTWEEFLKVLQNRPIKKRIYAALKKLFETFDTDNSGFITPDDLKKLIAEAGFSDQVTDEEINELVARVDTTGDGKISFEEFLAVFIE
eukprot:GHVN01002540.1.p2 GENE.GHVN01002540.1~~GHVN01002540.1.p2  ORF type:complete len:153 (+),score=22.74 GHVN01002540.1:116-574(+)